MDQQPKIPTLKDAQKPQVKIKGMGAGVTLFDRLKQFKKKDLAFILAGLGTLFMAPLAEHFMMAPESGDAALQQGWGGGKGPGSNLFGSGSSPYENGNNNIAQGGAIGGAGDIITPLNVRDPSALVMGPGAAQQPNAGAATPPAPPVTAPPSGGEDYKDALKGAASRAASAAVKRAPLPVPKVSLGGTNLRGLGVAGGGTSASGSLGPIGPAAGSNGANGGGGGLNLVRGAPGFRGVAGARSPTGSGLDGTKKAGANAGDAFSRTGSALSGLNAAANEQIPTGGQGYGGGGGGGAGANDKPGGGSGPGGSKSVGESLAFIEAKERMMENLKLEFEKRKLKDPELLLYGIRNDMLKAAGVKVGEALTKTAMCKLMGSGCPDPDAEVQCKTGSRKVSDLSPTCSGDVKDNCWQVNGPVYTWLQQGGNGDVCTVTGKKAGDTKPGSAVSGSNAASSGGVVSTKPAARTPEEASVGGLCSTLDPLVAGATGSKTPAAGEGKMVTVNKTSLDTLTTMRANAKALLDARTSLKGGDPDKDCGTGGSKDRYVNKLQPDASNALAAADAGVLSKLMAAVPSLSEAGKSQVAEAAKAVAKDSDIDKMLTDVEAQIKSAKASLAIIDKSKKSTFALEGDDQSDRLLGRTRGVLADANTLKGQLETFIGEAEARQKVLRDAQAKIVSFAAESGPLNKALLQNDEFDKMKQAKAGVQTIGDIDTPAKDAKLAPVKDERQLPATTKNAEEAMFKACGNAKCVVPATKPDPPKEEPDAKDETTDINKAIKAVKLMRDTHRGYISAIQADVIPAEPAKP